MLTRWPERVSPGIAREQPIRIIESGPAAGVLMAGMVGAQAGCEHLISFDMGGTTAKAALTGLSGTVSREYARHGITSNVVAPGMATRSTDEWLMSRSCHRAWSSIPATA